jgi:tRNA A37 threonylcarbamoyladenosine dehydratase
MPTDNWQIRTELLIGKDHSRKLNKSHVLVAGLGGVGGYAAEALVRAGIGEISLVDSDRISSSNRNRQLIALNSTEDRPKVEVLKERLLDINPELNIHAFEVYLKDEKIPAMLDGSFDYVVDAIDTLSPKVYFIKETLNRKLKLVSSMGAGGRLDPLKINVGDVSESYGCQFAQAVRKKLHGLGIRSGFQVVYSPEPALEGSVRKIQNESNKKSMVGTISYMPAMFGLTAASVVLRDLIGRG